MNDSKGSIDSIGSVAYKPIEIFNFRAPTVSIDAYFKLAAAKNSNELESVLDNFFADPDNSFALKVASEDLFAAWCKERSKRSVSSSKIYKKLLNYAIRMCTRPTPFGCFASVGLGHWNTSGSVSTNYGAICKHARLDMEWLLSLIGKINSIETVRRQIEYSLHPTCFSFGGRIYLNHIGGEHGLSGGTCKSIKQNKMVTRLMHLADSQVSYEVLVNQLTEFAGEERRSSVISMINSLIDQGFLISSLEPDPSDHSPAETLLARISKLSGVEVLARHLSGLLMEVNKLEKNNEKAEDNQFEEIKKAAARVTASANELCAIESQTSEHPVKNADRHIFQLDSTFRSSNVVLPDSVSETIARMSEILLRLTTFPTGLPDLHECKKQFLEKYGEHRYVPVLELLDPDIGIGNPYELSSASTSSSYSAKRDSHLNFLFSKTLRKGEKEIQLSTSDLGKLSTREDDARLPESVDAFVFLLAKSRAAIAAGDFKIAPGPYGMAFTAGRALGRFAYYLDAGTSLEFRDLFKPPSNEGESDVQMVCLPRRARSSNVVLSPLMRDVAIYLNCVPGKRQSDTDTVLFPRDVIVGVRNGQWQLKSVRTGDSLNVFAPHLLNLTSEPPLVRFLIDASRDGAVYPLSFSWGGLALQPFVPRITYDNLIISPATWQIETSSFTEKADVTKFTEEFESYRKEWDIPARCFIGVGDNRLLLDFSNPMHLQILHNQATKSHTSTIQVEEAFALEDFGWTEQDNKTYVTEIVASLTQIDKPHSGKRNEAGHDKDAKQHSTFSQVRKKAPGSEWLYLKLYTITQLEEDLIANDLLSFGESLIQNQLCRSWFFVRYADQKKHLRVRFHLKDPSDEIFQRVTAWASDLMNTGMCTEFAFDTYDREIERYGGDELLAVVEQIFHADSVACAHMLALTRNKTALSDDKLLTAIESIVSLVTSLGVSHNDLESFFQKYKQSKGLTHTYYRRLKDAISTVPGIAKVGFEQASRSQVHLAQRSREIEEVIENAQFEIIGDSMPGEIIASIVHMSLNRFLGLNREAETKVLGLLQRATLDRNIKAKQSADRKSAAVPT